MYDDLGDCRFGSIRRSWIHEAIDEAGMDLEIYEFMDMRTDRSLSRDLPVCCRDPQLYEFMDLLSHQSGDTG